MKTRFRHLLVTALLAVGSMSTTAASAAGGAVLVIEGSGNISPGLTNTPTNQTVSFNGALTGLTIAGTGTPVGLGSCSFSGASGSATIVSGNGSLSGGCSGATVGATSVGCTLAYARVGVIVVATANCTVIASGPLGSGATAAIGGGVFLFVPTSAPGAPVTAYALVGAGTAEGVGGTGYWPDVSVSLIAGSGSISPGLDPVLAKTQSMSFSGTGVGGSLVGAGTAAGIFSCSFSGGAVENVILGLGTASGTCTGATVGTATLSCGAGYNRVGALVVLTLNCNGTASGPAGSGSTTSAIGAGVFVFVPTSAPGAPVTSYSLAGAAAGAAA